MSGYTLHRGDALLLLPTLPAGCVHAVITDPPYNSGGRTPNDRTGASALRKYVSGDAASAQLPDFAGDSRDQRGYIAWMSLILANCLAATVDGAPLLVFSDWRQIPANSDALQAAGWIWRGIIPWHKPIARPMRGGFRRSCEYVLWATNGPVDGAANPVYLDGIVRGSQPRKGRVHITQKPLEVMRELVQVCVPGGVVLDPFAGSGTTGVAALMEGRGFLGIEQSRRYHTTAERRLREAAA
jgi:site-specific DNA-methyltransferase (adenine-specific)